MQLKMLFEKIAYEHTTDLDFKNWINGHKKNLKGYFVKKT
jgi:hypothetical protein